jgi:hypothetical protein
LDRLGVSTEEAVGVVVQSVEKGPTGKGTEDGIAFGEGGGSLVDGERDGRSLFGGGEVDLERGEEVVQEEGEEGVRLEDGEGRREGYDGCIRSHHVDVQVCWWRSVIIK